MLCGSTETFTPERARDGIATIFVLTIVQLALALLVATRIPNGVEPFMLKQFAFFVALAMAVNGAATIGCLLVILREKPLFSRNAPASAASQASDEISEVTPNT